MKKIILPFLLAILLLACQEKKHGAFVVSGLVTNAPEQKILLQEIPFAGEQPITLDSATLKKNGTFELRAMGKEEGLYRLQLEKGPAILVVNDGKSIRLRIDMNHFRQYQVEGSEATLAIHNLMEDYQTKDSTLYQTFILLDSLQKQKNDSAMTVALGQRDLQVKGINSFISDFIKKSPSPAVKYYAIGLASRTMQTEELKNLAIASANDFKEHSGLAKLKSLLTVQSATAPPAANDPLINKQAPEISLPDVNGKMISLSSFKGKYVLVDFWASWCGPCRAENPKLVAVYQKYKDKNFTILGVSLDEEKEYWLQAIKADQLTWTHISELKKWESKVVSDYGFDGIPYSVLIDPSGKVIATKLRSAELDQQLAQIFK
ncbi:MAG: hypothetical protein B7Y15_06985 [Bacteroidetes bacterium 24-39-8]|jgi:thiol-disulfide isomerase/thioredoxin|nr:MAG: hypothetical protein B7Y69_03860 [Sphingobacteriia bacterium 35-40-8]OYZ51139.1 MAG: hypothetical protein B7Y15_06985 [Bacteroidetes bacterium 24-39-8]OZA69210.1 MAG: hypothetical protein B7X72_00600 [Sphingobacteriia bacterium 39-39-8]HQR92284.1 TlpA disulfide reductase family protein [Sediminibacterium sp.]HQS55242.1 TlpA disulfide reductase family protein [Sediminibacterium sp.]